MITKKFFSNATVAREKLVAKIQWVANTKTEQQFKLEEKLSTKKHANKKQPQSAGEILVRFSRRDLLFRECQRRAQRRFLRIK